MKKTMILASMIGLLAGTSLWARGMEHDTREIEPEDAREISISGDFAAGEFLVSADDISLVALIDIRYDPRKVDYDIEYEVERGVGFLEIDSYNRRNFDLDTEDSQWEIVLSKRYPTSLELEIGACDAETLLVA